jgi:peptidoglycan/xylan/chitin deacetylase (PgdA/CDA1 family)
VTTPNAVPVLMFHSVADESRLAPHGWLQRLATAPALLEATFRQWKEQGWTTIGLEALSDWLDGQARIPDKSLAFTLDDGYLDNWVELDPLLSRFGFRAAIFVSTDYIDGHEGTRPQAGAAPANGVTWKGYLSANEMREMERRGTAEFGSHACTHTWWFTSNRIVDWYRPEISVERRESLLRFLWLNAHPDQKSSVLREMTAESIPWGTPIYEFAPALVARRYVPDPAETDLAVDLVASHGGSAFFRDATWRETLDDAVRKFRSGRRPSDQRETETEHVARVRNELATSRARLSEILGRDVRILSCPQGAMSPLVETIARDVGYRRWTMSVWRHRRLNRPGASDRHIYRCGRGYELFGPHASPSLLLRSHSLVLARYAGSTWARGATAALTLAARLARRNGDDTATD